MAASALINQTLKQVNAAKMIRGFIFG